ncbi:putative Very long-chain fatty acid transport protein [Glarea lozoyensis 74030]|uniref:Putative Very long-chain fatty acid transport protein n=1 Tax=Glarea lozoyensis (strain ATCC 74030 / MF5533) TaxID=1104152 RepID=H0EG08_GLAL7|nr:putative Very long-chain fatty acid transport protein [Glarea lozoyensis 74030]
MFDKVNEGIEFLWFEGRTWTYGEMKRETQKLAAFLESAGVKKGDYVGVFMANSPEMHFSLSIGSYPSEFSAQTGSATATRILYVGELCRYLVHSPPTPYDRAHKCIVAAGNGLRAEIWDAFKEKFGVDEIREFYRSTEGLAKYDNFNYGAWGGGKVGFAGPLRRYLENDTIIVLSDPATEKPYRDPKTGFCIRAKLGEVGEAIGRVKNRGLLTEYLNNSPATEEKIMRDVFEKGDCFQSTGDLVIQDESGWVRFHDRMGDTFRWKGENVSAGEVREHLAKLDGVIDAVVYGVKLPSYDGQAGAAAITLDGTSEAVFMNNLYAGLKKTGLPSYAMPRLVRITPEIEANATFKKSKGDLVKKTPPYKFGNGLRAPNLWWGEPRLLNF